MKKICVLGASYGWTRTLVNDLLSVFKEPIEVRFIDIVAEAAEICAKWGEAASKSYGRADRYVPFTDRRAALNGADAVLITLSTGGLDAMENDVAIPEKYGIFATVGDTAGPGGWSRSIRNIPVFMEFAKDFNEICPNAFIANYTNPMSSLTATLQKSCANPVSGFCHAYFSTLDIIQHLFGLPDWNEIAVEIAGMNHFTWVTDFKITGQDGYKALKKKIGGGALLDILPKKSTDEIGFHTGHSLFSELYDTFGYLPYPADRHISEFLSFPLSGWPKRVAKKDSKREYDAIERNGIIRTPMSHRRENFASNKQHMLNDTERLASVTEQTPPKSRETGAEMINCYLNNGIIMDAVNTLNIGQMPGFPANACVETLGVVDGFGVRPVTVKTMPESLFEIMRPQAVCQGWLVTGMLNKNKDMLYNALYQDPQCAFMYHGDIKKMADELLEANKPHMNGYL